jgi:hypothetical protein
MYLIYNLYKMIFDPWSEENNNLINLMNNNELNILGPISSKKKERFIIKLNIENNNDRLIFKSDMDINTGLRYIYIKIYNNIGTIENISKSIIYNGSEYLMLSLQLLFLLNIKKVNLHDDSYFICHKKTEMEPYKKMSYKIISLLRYGNTFYMQFGFKHISKKYNKNNKIIYTDMSNNIYSLIDKLRKISWNDINDIIVKGVELIKNGKNVQNNKSWRKLNQEKWIKYWMSIYNSWSKFKEKYCDTQEYPLTPFGSFAIYDNSDCALFCDWLELYSNTYLHFKNVNQYIFNNEIVEIPGLNEFRQCKIILDSCNWINDNIHGYPVVLKR